MAEIKVKPSLIVQSRLRVLYDIVNEMARSFSVDNQESVTQTLRRGIFERQYLSAVHIYLLDAAGKKQAQISLEIDWKLHQVRIASGESQWQVDPNRSLLEQVSGVYRVIQEHVQSMKAAFGIVRSEAWFTYRRDIDYNEAREYVGTGTGTEPQWSADSDGSPHVSLEFVAKALEELRVTVKHKRKVP